jgi:quinoprotein glucose dehydrogenase
MKIEIAAAAVVGLMGIGCMYCLPVARGAEWQESGTSAQARSVWDGVYTKEQAKRGDKLYHGQCASCHGEMLTGGEAAPPLAGGEFLSNWNGLTVGDLFERIRISMPQDHPGRLSRQENADILAYVLSVNKFPAGKTELQQRTEVLKEIRFEATRPDERK